MYDDWKTTPPDDDYYESSYDSEEEEREAPLFGCACENPSSVDEVCDGCRAWLDEQGRPGLLRRNQVAASLYRRHSRRSRRAIRTLEPVELPF